MNIFDVVRQIRNNVHDPNPPVLGRTTVLYPDQIYIDKIYFALNKLNMDLRNLTDFSPLPPWNIATIPNTLSFLLLKLATIEMMQVRGAESVGISMVDNSTASTGITHVTVPDLTVIFDWAGMNKLPLTVSFPPGSMTISELTYFVLYHVTSPDIVNGVGE